MLRISTILGTAAVLLSAGLGSAQFPGGPGRGPGPGPNIGPQFQPGFPGGPSIQIQPNQQFNRGNQWNGNRGWNWGNPAFTNRWGAQPFGIGNQGVSIWFAPYGAWNVPMTSRWPAYASLPPVSAAVPIEVAGQQYGMQITQVMDNGGAKQADLREGDVILGVGQTRIQSFTALQAALIGAREVEIVFINHDNNRVEKVPVPVDNGKMGVAVMPIALQ